MFKFLKNILGKQSNKFLQHTDNNEDSKAEASLIQSNSLQLPFVLEKYRDQFEKTLKPYIKISAKKSSTLPWESKFGGNPYLLSDIEYPKDAGGNPLRLLAQINFEEVPEIDFFPKSGIVQFYISSKDDVYGLNFDNQTDQDKFRIIYIPNIIRDTSILQKDFHLTGHDTNDYFPIDSESKLQFSLEYAPVSVEDFQFEQIFGTSGYSFFDEFSKENSHNSNIDLYDWYVKNYSGSGHKMGGYAYFTQSDPRENNKYKDYKVLLLQVDTDDAASIMWGDCGVANFFISPEDLMNLKFSDVIYNWDCC